MKEEILRVERVTYMENDVLLLEDLNLQIFRGEIMAMLSINSHGLSAFLKLLQTNCPLYDGYVYFGGEKVNSWKTSNRGNNRISIIQAKSSLIEKMSVTDNIFVMRQGFGQEVLRTKLLSRQLMPFLEEIGMDIRQETYVENLTVFERMIVELLRAVVAGHRLIVLDGVGALLRYEELERLHEILRHYAGEGFSFLYICSHFEEIARLCDRAALFSEGRILKVILHQELQEEILRLYTDEYDRLVRNHRKRQSEYRRENERIFSLNLEAETGCRGVSFSVQEGECLMLQVLENETMLKIVGMLTGKQSMPEKSAWLGKKPVKIPGDCHVAVIQELPTKSMVFPELSYMDNLCISLEGRMHRGNSRKIRESIRQEYSKNLGSEVFSMHIDELSEKQKYRLVYTRVLLQKPRIVICINPFKGADLPHRILIWQLLETLLRKNIAVVLLSVSLSDALSLADRLLVIDSDGSRTEILRHDFSDIARQVPWIHLYQ